MGVDGKEYFSGTLGTFGGNSKMEIYGRLNCQSALFATLRFHGSFEKFRVFFADERTALAAGFRPSGKCLRGKYKEYMAAPQKYQKNLAYKAGGMFL